MLRYGLILLLLSARVALAEGSFAEQVREAHTAVAMKKQSLCRVTTELLGELRRTRGASARDYIRDALIIFGDESAVRPHLERLQGQVDRLPIAAGCKRGDLHPPPSAPEWARRRQELTGLSAKDWPRAFSSHGDSRSAINAQGWRQGFRQQDYDATGRVDHFLFHAYLQLTLDELRRCTRLPVPTEAFVRFSEEGREDQDAEAFFRRSGADLLSDQGFWTGYPDGARAARARDLVARLLELDPVHEKKESARIASELASQMDVEINRRGRTFARKISRGELPGPRVLTNVFQTELCDEARGRSHGYYQ